MEVFITILVLAVAGFLIFNMFRSRKRNMEAAAKSGNTAAATGLAVSRDLFQAEAGHHAPVESFHVHGHEARVTFAVPLDDEDDAVLNELLVDEAVEVVRQKRHTLPIEDVQEIVVYAGIDNVREVGRSVLPAPGELPPPTLDTGLSFSKIAHDPFAAPFEDEVDHSVTY